MGNKQWVIFCAVSGNLENWVSHYIPEVLLDLCFFFNCSRKRQSLYVLVSDEDKMHRD